MTAIALTIAGSDSSGGAGIQADLKTFSALGVYGACVVTAVTAQNTRGVSAVDDISPGMIDAQITAVLDDLSICAIKIGMLSRCQTIETVADALAPFRGPIILDPVMVATSGDRLLRSDAVSALKARLLPHVHVVTPNLHEAADLTGLPFAKTVDDAIVQARRIKEEGARSVLVKGGHGKGDEAVDILLTENDDVHMFRHPRLQTHNDHGTGCTLSAAIAAGMAKGQTLLSAVGPAKAYLHAALAAGQSLQIGRGRGPVHHFFAQWQGGE